MTPTEPTATRDKARTRLAILDAARTLFTEHGAGVSLADIAHAAGVSKGALTHHFPNRDALVAAVITQVIDLFREEVDRHIDHTEAAPGRLLRGYIRALTSDSMVMRQTFAPGSLLNIIGLEHPLQHLSETDAAEWRTRFASDGVDESLSLVLRLAAEGVACSVDTPYLTPAELARSRQRLLELATPSHAPSTHPFLA